MKKIILFSALVLGSVGAWAQAPAGISFNSVNIEDCERFPSNDSDRASKVKQCQVEKFEKQVTSEVSSLRGRCHSELSKVSDARKKATDSCSQARIGGKDLKACSSKVRECSELRETQDEESEYDELNQLLLTQSGALNGSAASIFDAGARRAVMCPNFTTEEYESQLRTIREKQQGLTKEFEEIEQTQKAAALKYEEEIARIDKELRDLPSKLKGEVSTETANRLELLRLDREKEAAQNAEISKTEIEISDAIQKIADLEAKRTTDLSKITDYRNKETCRATIAKLKEDLLKKPGSRSLQTGLQRSSSLKSKLENEFKTCYAAAQASRREISRSFDSQVASLNKRIEVANKNIEAALKLRAEARKAIEDQIAKLPEKEKEIERQFEDQRRELLRQRDAMTTEYNNGLEAAKRQIQNLNEQNAEQRRLLADLGQKPRPGAKKTTDEVDGELGSLETVVEEAIAACGCNVTAADSTNVMSVAKSKLKDGFANECSNLDAENDRLKNNELERTPADAPRSIDSSKGIDGKPGK